MRFTQLIPLAKLFKWICCLFVRKMTSSAIIRFWFYWTCVVCAETKAEHDSSCYSGTDLRSTRLFAALRRLSSREKSDGDEQLRLCGCAAFRCAAIVFGAVRCVHSVRFMRARFGFAACTCGSGRFDCISNRLWL